MSNLFSEADIKRLVHVFYGDVRKDALLAPIFATKIPEDHWPAHMAHICDFWSSIFLQTGRFNGRPLQKHLLLNGLTPDHFNRWLSLFQHAAKTCLSEDQAREIEAMAQRIAQSFQMGLAMHYQNKGADNPFAQFGLKPPS